MSLLLLFGSNPAVASNELSVNVSDSTTSSESLTVVFSIDSLSDNYNLYSGSASSFGSKWSYGGGNFNFQSVISGQPTFSTQTTSQYSSLYTTNAWGMKGSSAYVQIVSAGNQSILSHETIFYVDQDSGGAEDFNNKVYLSINQGTVGMRQIISGAASAITSTIPYNSVAHQWVRFRESAGTFFVDFAPDGVNWTNQWSFASPINLSTNHFGIQEGTFSSETLTTTSVFDNFNFVLNALVNVSDSSTVNEATKTTLVNIVSVSDSATLTETSLGQIASSISVSDSIALTETTAQRTVSLVSVSDAITLTETPTARIAAFISVSDSTTVGETISVNTSALSISVNDIVSTQPRTNNIVNPNFETNDLYWSATGGTAAKAQSAAQAFIGSKSLVVTGSAVGDGTYFQPNDGFTPVNGQTYTISMYVQGSGQNVRLWAYTGTADTYGADIVLTSAWTRYSFTFTAAATSGLFCGIRLNGTGSTTVYVDAVQIEPGTVATSYFDGSTGGTWTGTAHNSTSTMAGETLSVTTAFAPLTISVSDTIYSGDIVYINNGISIVDPPAVRAIHIGSQSLDVHTNTQTDTDNIVTALVTAIPNLTHIVVAPYFDYGNGSSNDQFVKWATSIHNAGKKMIVRSPGYTDWMGVNGTTQYTSADFATHFRAQIQLWVDANYAIFQAGDIFEPLPDEPENNSMWNSTYGTIGSGAGKLAYNAFIQGAISDVNAKLAAHGVTGVETGIVFTNPSASKDVITSDTAALLLSMGTDDYPETAGTTTAAAAAALMQSEIDTWIAGQQQGKAWNMTFGPNVNVQLPEAVQADTVWRELNIIKNSIKPLNGITFWQFGAVDNNPKSRLFDWDGASWTPRSMVTSVINNVFATLGGSITTRESTKLTVVSLISLTESVTTTESISLVTTVSVSVADSITVSETPQQLITSFVSVSDTSTASESTSARVPFYSVIVSDSATVSEAINLQGQDRVSVTDASTVSETVTVNVAAAATAAINVNDTVTSSETVNVNLRAAVSLSDASSLTETINIALVSYLAIADAATLSESLTLLTSSYITASDASVLSETMTVYTPLYLVFVAETATTSEVVGIYDGEGVFVSDATSLTETVAILVTNYPISVTDSVTLTEIVSIASPLVAISAADSATTSEQIIVTGSSGGISVNESTTLTENVAIALSAVIISVVDVSTVSESVNQTVVLNAQVMPGIQMLTGVKIVG